MASVANRAEAGPLDKSVEGRAFAIVPSDTVNLPIPIERIYVGGAGNVTILTVGGDTTTFTAPAVGSTLAVNGCIRVMSTGTTATLLVGSAHQSFRK